MAYIQKFLEQQLPAHLLLQINSQTTSASFHDHLSSPNIYSMTFDLLSLAHHPPGTPTSHWLTSFIQQQLWINYQELQNYQLVASSSDSALVSAMKKSWNYVQNSMYQLMLRLYRIFLECQNCQFLGPQVLTLIDDVSLIYPILKTEISINYPEVNLSHFTQHILNQISTQTSSQTLSEALKRLVIKCNFMGSLEKTINQIIQQKQKQHDLLSKTIQFSSNDSQEESDRQTKVNQTHKIFNQAQLFRKKKSKRTAIITRPNEPTIKATKSMSTIEATPVKKGNQNSRRTPRSQRKSESKDKTQTLKKKTFFKKIRKQIKPLERTIYHNETKKFIPKKHQYSIEQTLELKHSLTGDTSMNFSQTQKKNTNKSRAYEQEVQGPLFGVPETPKPLNKKIRSRIPSGDIFHVGRVSLRN